VVVFFLILEEVFAIDLLRVDAGQELSSLSIESVQVDVEDLTVQARVSDGKVNVVDVFSFLTFIALFSEVFSIKLSEGSLVAGEDLNKLARNSDILMVVI
jgi:hypothetical protein